MSVPPAAERVWFLSPQAPSAFLKPEITLKHKRNEARKSEEAITIGRFSYDAGKIWCKNHSDYNEFNSKKGLRFPLFHEKKKRKLLCKELLPAFQRAILNYNKIENYHACNIYDILYVI